MRVNRIIALSVVASVLAIPSAVGAQTLPIRTEATVVKKEVSAKQQQQLRSLTKKIARLQVATWRCQDTLRTKRLRPSVTPWALPPSVLYRTWVHVKWKVQKASCELALLKRAIPPTNDWQTSVRLVQRIYPGTSNWLLTISRREGGWGGFVMNTQGSGCGGWLQYAPSTYWAYSGDAFADAKRRGFIVDPAWNQWTHPMGQALTGAYMRFTGRDGSHWSQTNSGF